MLHKFHKTSKYRCVEICFGSTSDMGTLNKLATEKHILTRRFVKAIYGLTVDFGDGIRHVCILIGANGTVEF